MREISDLTDNEYSIAYYIGKMITFNGEIYYSVILLDPLILSQIQ